MPIDPISLALNAANTGFSFLGARADHRRNLELINQQNRANKQLAGQQQQWNLEQWNRQNAYNDPASQMARLNEAGLNPNLLYGQGVSGATGQAGAVQPYNRATAETVKGARVFQDTMQSRNLNAQTNNIEANTGYIQEKKQTEQLTQLLKGIQGKSDNEKYKILSQISDAQVDKYLADTRKSQLSADFLGNTLDTRTQKLGQELKNLQSLGTIREKEAALKQLMVDKESFFKGIYGDPQLQSDLKKLIPQLTQITGSAVQKVLDAIDTANKIFGYSGNPFMPNK